MDKRDMIECFGRMDFPEGFSVDLSKMKVDFYIDNGEGDEPEHHSIPIRWEVCDTCNGKGKYVNPNIDRNGISSSDFYEDPDFRNDYFSGVYDVCCAKCNGRTTIPCVSLDYDDQSNPSWNVLKEWRKEMWDSFAEDRAEMHYFNSFER